MEVFFLLSPPLLSPVPPDLSMRVSRSTRNEISLDFGRRIGGMLQSARHNLILLCTRPRIICAPRKVSPVFYGNTKLHLNIIFRKCSVIFSNFPLLTFFFCIIPFPARPSLSHKMIFFQTETGGGGRRNCEIHLFPEFSCEKWAGFAFRPLGPDLSNFPFRKKRKISPTDRQTDLKHRWRTDGLDC